MAEKKIFNVYEAKTHFSRLLRRVMGGEEVLIGKAGKPIARLVPISAKPARREPGSAAGKIHIAADFDTPLPDEVLETFET